MHKAITRERQGRLRDHDVLLEKLRQLVRTDRAADAVVHRLIVIEPTVNRPELQVASSVPESTSGTGRG